MRRNIGLTLIAVTMIASINFTSIAATNTQRKIAFVSKRDGHAQIYLMNEDGSEQVNISNNDRQEFGPSWSPDGEYLAFASSNDEVTDIYTMRADGSDRRRWTDDYRHTHDSPSWSPDGKYIAFLSGGAVSIIDIKKNIINRLTIDSPARNIGLSWSPDGQWIAFTSDEKIILVDCQRHRMEIGADIDGLKYQPTWVAPSLLAFTSTNKNQDKTFVVDIENHQRVSRILDKIAFANWTSDGQKIVFVGGDLTNDDETEIFTINADETNKRQLTHNQFADFGPAWQPQSAPDIEPTMNCENLENTQTNSP